MVIRLIRGKKNPIHYFYHFKQIPAICGISFLIYFSLFSIRFLHCLISLDGLSQKQVDYTWSQFLWLHFRGLFWFGWGYCLCTDWHWDIREKLGYTDESGSYIHFLILKLTGVNMNPQLVNNVTLIVFVASAALSIWINIRDRSRLKHKSWVVDWSVEG